VTSTDRNRTTTEAAFDYFRCQGCGLVYMDPIPEDMRPFYAGGYQRIPATVEELRVMAAPERYRLEPVQRYKRSGKLLEIGPWTGIFSSNAKDAGFEVTAIEIDQTCVDFLNGQVGIRALQSSDPAKTLDAMEEQFDVIALWHCLEHLPSPWRVVEAAARRLAPGGILLVAIPNIESNEFAFLKGRWRHLDAPRHIYFFPPESLVELARTCGLEERELTTTDHLSWLLGEQSWMQWGREVFRVKYLRGATGRLAFMVSWNKARRENSGSGITAVFQRPGELGGD
jgi:SAM-dependent methyltransferase